MTIGRRRCRLWQVQVRPGRWAPTPTWRKWPPASWPWPTSAPRCPRGLRSLEVHLAGLALGPRTVPAEEGTALLRTLQALGLPARAPGRGGARAPWRPNRPLSAWVMLVPLGGAWLSRMNAGFSASGRSRRLPSRPTWGSTPCSTGARRRPGSAPAPRAAAPAQGPGPAWPTSSSKPVLDQLPGDAAIGHTRYSTTGGNVASAAHPFLVEGRFGQVALCHNGNLTNTEQLRSRLIQGGQVFSSPSDSEVILALINRAAARHPGGRPAGGPDPGGGGLFHPAPHRDPADGGARPPRLPAPGHGPPGRGHGVLQRDLRLRPAGRRLPAGGGARGGGDPGPGRLRSRFPLRRSGPSPACSSTCISPGRIPWSTA